MTNFDNATVSVIRTVDNSVVDIVEVDYFPQAVCVLPDGDYVLVGNFGTPPPAKYVHDELCARCFVLDDGTTRIALVVSDNIYISREVLDDAKRQVTEATGLPADRMLMSCTHTHSSVSARWSNPLRPGKEFTEYQRFVAHRIADGVRCAIHNLQPARIAWGTAD